MGFKNFKQGEYIPTANKCVKTKVAKYRSSWELSFCRLLDKADIVKSWEFEQFFIKYYFAGRKRTYIVDFFVVLQDGKKFLIEIKPLTFFNKAMADKGGMNWFKWEAAMAFAANHNYAFKVLTEHTLPILVRSWSRTSTEV